MRKLPYLFLLACLLAPALVFPAPNQPASGSDQALQAANQDLEAAQKEVQKLRDAWDKTRLEATLYDQRAKRAYQKWIKAAKSLRAQALAVKVHADLEFQLAVEKRKLAFVILQEAVFRQAELDAKVRELDQKKDEADIRAKMRELQTKLTPVPAS
jgi:hypothetical protein